MIVQQNQSIEIFQVLKIIIATFTFMIEILCLVLFRIPNEIQHETALQKKSMEYVRLRNHILQSFLRLCAAFYGLDFAAAVVVLSLVLTKV